MKNTELEKIQNNLLIPQRINALGLGKKYKVKFAGSADALWAELYDAKKKGRGLLMFNWSPIIRFNNYKILTIYPILCFSFSFICFD